MEGSLLEAGADVGVTSGPHTQRQALLASLALVNPLSTLQQQSNVGGAQNFIDQLNSEFN